MKILRSLVNRKRIGDQGRGHELFGGQRIRLDRPLAAVLKRRLADRSAARPLAFAPVVVLAAGVFTLFSVSHFTVHVARSAAVVARYERLEERGNMDFIFGRSGPRAESHFEHALVNRTLDVMVLVPRHRFVPEIRQDSAYRAAALSIGWGRTIPDAYMVALIAELATRGRARSVLEIGTGAGYQAAVLSEMVDHVYTIEPVEPLALLAASTLRDLGYGNVTVRVDDGDQGWPEVGPFDSIVIKAPVDHVPEALFDQLVVGGKLVAPVGPPGGPQELQLLEKRADGSVERTSVLEVRFPPLINDR